MKPAGKTSTPDSTGSWRPTSDPGDKGTSFIFVTALWDENYGFKLYPVK